MRLLSKWPLVALLIAAQTPSIPQTPTAVQQSTDDSLTTRLRMATEEAAGGNIAAALADARAAVALNPNRADGWYALGSVQGQAGNFAEAESALRGALELDPHLAKAHYSLALTLIANPQNKLDWTGAIDQCRQALKEQPDYPEALNLLGTGLTNTGKPDEAIVALRRAIQLSPSLAPAHLSLALALETQENWDEAAQQYRAAIAAKSDYPEAFTGLGKLLLRQGDEPGAEREAERVLDGAIRLNPDLNDAHYALARALRAHGRPDEAAIEFAIAQDLIQRQPNGIQALQLSNRALVIASHGDLAGAVALLRQAIALKPDYGVPHYNLGLILADSGDTAGSVRELNKAISLLPGEAKPWFDLGRVLRVSGDKKGTLHALQWAAHLAPPDGNPTGLSAKIAAELATFQQELASAAAGSPLPEIEQPKVGLAADTASAHRAFAEQLRAQGDLQGAEGELLRALSLDPSSIAPRRELAQDLLAMGERDRALLEYAKTVRVSPEDPDAQLEFGQLLLSQGNPEQAVAHLRLACRYRPNSASMRSALRLAEREAAASSHKPR